MAAPDPDAPRNARPRLSKAMRWIVIGGTVTWVASALTNPSRWAARMGATEAEVKALARRDAKNAFKLLRAKDPLAAFAERVMYDSSDAVRYGKDRPGVIAATAGFALLSATGAAAEIWDRRNAR